MFDVEWFINDVEFFERYDIDQEIEAIKRYKELVECGKCEWVQISKLIDNWSSND